MPNGYWLFFVLNSVIMITAGYFSRRIKRKPYKMLFQAFLFFELIAVGVFPMIYHFWQIKDCTAFTC